MSHAGSFSSHLETSLTPEDKKVQSITKVVNVTYDVLTMFFRFVFILIYTVFVVLSQYIRYQIIITLFEVLF